MKYESYVSGSFCVRTSSQSTARALWLLHVWPKLYPAFGWFQVRQLWTVYIALRLIWIEYELLHLTWKMWFLNWKLVAFDHFVYTDTKNSIFILFIYLFFCSVLLVLWFTRLRVLVQSAMDSPHIDLGLRSALTCTEDDLNELHP